MKKTINYEFTKNEIKLLKKGVKLLIKNKNKNYDFERFELTNLEKNLK